MSRIAVMGSAFNPPSLGHKDVVEQALTQCDQVWLVPAFRHAWGKKMAPYEYRCQMVKLFTQDLADPRVSMHAIEHKIATDKPVYSFDLLEALQAQLRPEDQLFLVIGPDNAAAFDKFYRADDIRRRWQLLVVKERISVRSTKIRAALQHHKTVSAMTTPGVAAFLATHPMYGEATS